MSNEHFIHPIYRPGETVAAIATPPGEGGVAIVRISGGEALDVAARVFTGEVKSYRTHTVHYGYIRDLQGKVIDDVLLMVLLGKRSYTGEDTVEVHCHGGGIIVRRVLEAILAAGARAAAPGEFTFKAFMNGKLDLAQAEAVQQLIGAKNEYAADAARSHLEGRLSERVGAIQQQFTEIAAILEAWVDFPEEGLEFATVEEIITQVQEGLRAMSHLLETYHEGRIISEGVALCLVGSPNVGKSSLMNALLDKERAIVSAIAGTTRDTVEDNLRLGGLHLRLIDTAGIRETAELIEREGIRRSKAAIQAADLVLFVLDATRGLTEEDRSLAEELSPHSTIAVWNKCDLVSKVNPPLLFPHVVEISALRRVGLDALKAAIHDVIWRGAAPKGEEIVISSVRHKEALMEAAQAAEALLAALQVGASAEFAAIEMRSCLKALGKILGADITEDILSAIFSKFCVGK